MPEIHRLDQATRERIAAGEVVERPASVVKELVENALDADADRIDVAVEAGGTEGVRVADDGVGMTAEELAVAVEEHTTSKIADIDDLESGVATLGFRGEALHTIGAVSRMTVRSKPRDADGAGHELVVDGGDVGDVGPVGCPEGTVVEVADLFDNTPARKKFLASESTEFDHVNRVVTQYALANPDVAVSLTHDGRQVFATDGGGDLRSAVLAVYGREVAEAMVAADADPAGPVESVHGLVSHPETTRAGREYLSTFVNDRYVTDGALREAIVAAYGGQLAADRYPFAVVFVEVAPDAVDANVHPRKLEVRFDDEAAVREAVEDAVREALLDHGLVRSRAARGRSAPEETAVRPGEAGAGDAGEDVDVAERRSTGSTDSGSADTTDQETVSSTSSGKAVDGPAGTPDEPSEVDDGVTDDAGGDPDDALLDGFDDWSVEDVGGGTSVADDEVGAEDFDRGGLEAGSSPAAGFGTDAVDDDDEVTADDGEIAAADEATTADDLTDPHAIRSRDDNRPQAFTRTDQRTLDGEEVEAGGEFAKLPRLRVLGQLRDTYVVAEAPQGLVLIDQHAADERINYERLREALGGDVATQALAEPVELSLTAREAELFAAHADALAAIGFRAERVDDRTVQVEAVPAVFDATLDPDVLHDALGAIVADDREDGEPVAAVVDDLLADLACYPSVTGNTSLTEGSVTELLSALDDCENPYACPHGRPVIVAFDEAEIEDRFERDYPGHS